MRPGPAWAPRARPNQLLPTLVSTKPWAASRPGQHKAASLNIEAESPTPSASQEGHRCCQAGRLQAARGSASSGYSPRPTRQGPCPGLRRGPGTRCSGPLQPLGGQPCGHLHVQTPGRRRRRPRCQQHPRASQDNGTAPGPQGSRQQEVHVLPKRGVCLHGRPARSLLTTRRAQSQEDDHGVDHEDVHGGGLPAAPAQEDLVLRL